MISATILSIILRDNDDDLVELITICSPKEKHALIQQLPENIDLLELTECTTLNNIQFLLVGYLLGKEKTDNIYFVEPDECATIVNSQTIRPH